MWYLVYFIIKMCFKIYYNIKKLQRSIKCVIKASKLSFDRYWTKNQFKFCKIRWCFQVQSNTVVYLSFLSIYINPVYMKHLIKGGLGGLKCCACVWFDLVVVDRVAKTLLQNKVFVFFYYCVWYTVCCYTVLSSFDAKYDKIEHILMQQPFSYSA